MASTDPRTAHPTQSRAGLLREGVVTGLIGAATVALIFLIADVLRGTFFFTPAALGSALFMRAGSAADVQVTAGIVAAYTVVHVVAFVVVGLVAAGIMRGAERYPPLLFLAVLLFVTLEAFFIGLLAILAVWLLDLLAWWTVAVANLLAAIAMGAYLWNEHPRLRGHLGREDLEAPRVG